MGYKYFVHGAGKQGLAAIYDLVKNCEADSVKIFEPSQITCDRASGRLSKLLDQPSFSRIQISSTPYDDNQIKECDVVLSCAPHFANVGITKKCLALDIPMCDLGGNPEVVKQQEELSDGYTTPIVPECGVSPGISNILACYLATEGATHIKVRCGGLPLLAPCLEHNALRYKLVFSPEGLISEYSGRVPIIQGGKLQTIDALCIIEQYDDEMEASPTSNNAPQVVESLLHRGVQEYNYMTLRYKGHWDIIRSWKLFGWLCGNPIQDEVLKTHLKNAKELQYDPALDQDKLILTVRGSKHGGVDVFWDYKIYLCADVNTRFSAMELATSWGITMIAHYMADVSDPANRPLGFATPEDFVSYTWFLQQLNKRLLQYK